MGGTRWIFRVERFATVKQRSGRITFYTRKGNEETRCSLGKRQENVDRENPIAKKKKKKKRKKTVTKKKAAA